MHRTKSFVVAAVAVALLATLFPPAAHAAAAPTSKPYFGVQFHATWDDYTDAQRIEVLDKLQAAGVHWVRVDMGWASLQESSKDSYTQYHVDKADWIVNQARARGINVLGMLWRTPDWANGGAGPTTPPTDVDDYGRIARWAADHFKGRVAAWEVWNEPNLDYFWNGSATDYVRLLKAAYPQFKAGDPTAEVVLGGPSYNDTGWLKNVYDAGAQGYFDVMATHPYQGVADAPPETPDDGTMWTLSHVAAVHDLMVKHGDGDKEIWFTEFGWSSHPNQPDYKNWERGVTMQQQGDYLVRTIAYVRNKFPYVTHMFWYNERNRDSDDQQLANFGLLYRNLAPKPAYDALKDYLGGSSQPAPTSPDPEPTTPAVEPTAPAPDASIPAPDPSTPVSTDPVTDPLPSVDPTAAPATTPPADAPLPAESPAPADGATPPADAPAPAPPVRARPARRGNVLKNASFERGRGSWKTRGGGLSTTRVARSGNKSGNIHQRHRVARVLSAPVTVHGGRVRAGGYFRSTRGRRIQIVVIERRRGKTIGRSRRHAVATSTRWQRMPRLSYRLRSRRSRVLLKINSKGRHGRTLIDDLYVRPSR